MIRIARQGAAWALVGLSSLAGCGDPVVEAAVAALGPEDRSVPAGPRHRPGQPCLLCHREGGSGEVYSVAGTVYARRGQRTPIEGVSVVMLDAAGRSFIAKTNCAGNFYVAPSAFAPRYPFYVTVRLGDAIADMESPVNGDGSCGTCHQGREGPTSAGPIYLLDDPLASLPAAATRGCR